MSDRLLEHRPMGPLEKGDQAIVDAMSQIDIAQSSGLSISVLKSSDTGQTVGTCVSIFRGKLLSSEQVCVEICNDGILARSETTTSHNRYTARPGAGSRDIIVKKRSIVSDKNSNVQTTEDIHAWCDNNAPIPSPKIEPNRKQNQQVKLDVAKRLITMTQGTNMLNSFFNPRPVFAEI